MILHKFLRRLLVPAFTALILTAAIAAEVSALEIYIPDTAEISDPVSAESDQAPQTADPSDPDDDPEPDDETKSDKEKETTPTKVDYMHEMIVPAAVLLVLSVSAFAVCYRIKYRNTKK